jgi:hypothetical protein
MRPNRRAPERERAEAKRKAIARRSSAIWNARYDRCRNFGRRPLAPLLMSGASASRLGERGAAQAAQAAKRAEKRPLTSGNASATGKLNVPKTGGAKDLEHQVALPSFFDDCKGSRPIVRDRKAIAGP